MAPSDIRDHCLSMAGAEEDFPFSPETSVFRVTKKIFAISQLGADPLEVSVKCDPDLGESLRLTHDAIVPGYHLNKRHWITITLNLDADDGLVRDLIRDSYDLVSP